MPKAPSVIVVAFENAYLFPILVVNFVGENLFSIWYNIHRTRNGKYSSNSTAPHRTATQSEPKGNC
jgi:hypothetical protein